jgi:hypothetical protein
LAAERAVSSTLALQPLLPAGEVLGWGVATSEGAADDEGEGEAGAADAEGEAAAGEADADALGLAAADAEGDGTAGEADGDGEGAAGEGETDGLPQLIEVTVMVACEADSQVYPKLCTWPAGRPPN